MSTTTGLVRRVVLSLSTFLVVSGFVFNRVSIWHPSEYSSTQLCMGKAINKQAELRRKMELAKQKKRQEENSPSATDPVTNDPLSDKQIKERNDRKRFEELLKTSQASAVWNDYASSDGYMNHKQVQEEFEAQRKGVDRIFEGDPAPTQCFSALIDIETGQELNENAMKTLIPEGDDYLLVLCDPRAESEDLRQTTKELYGNLSPDDRRRLIVINSDSPAENKRWLKKQPLPGQGRVYSDPNRQWMRTYTALGTKRWYVRSWDASQ